MHRKGNAQNGKNQNIADKQIILSGNRRHRESCAAAGRGIVRTDKYNCFGVPERGEDNL